MKISDDLKIEGECRCCNHFFRIKEQYTEDVLQTLGFCNVGRLEGDYSLVQYCGKGNRCSVFVQNGYNTETSVKEHNLDRDLRQFNYNIIDGRTKEFELIKKMSISGLDLDKFIKSNPDNRWIAYRMNQKLRKVLFNLFFEMHKKEFEWLHDRDCIDEKDYFSLLNKINTVFDSKLILNQEVKDNDR